jgi:hypothetical protein
MVTVYTFGAFKTMVMYDYLTKSMHAVVEYEDTC